ncbi:MAG: hypothetical protein GY822_22015 [Deltaproteobacteria bacterium]|nr:hypothetical protein [Deltaproteobacteria bacterium]
MSESEIQAPAAHSDMQGRPPGGKLEPETLRIQPLGEGLSPTDFTVWNLVNAMGQMVPAPVEDAIAPLTYPDGKTGEWELALAMGDVDVVRDQLEPMLNEEVLAKGEGDASDDEVMWRGLSARAHIMDGDLLAAAQVLKGLRNDERMCLTEACLCVGEGAVSRAREKINVAMGKNPMGVVEHYIHGLVCVAEGDYQRGIDELNRVSDSSQEHAVARHQLAQLVLATGDAARAGTLFEMAIELAPTFLPPTIALAELLSDSHQYGDAVRILSHAAEAAPQSVAPRLLMLRIYLEVGELVEAGTTADELYKLAPEHDEVRRLWAETCVRNGRSEEAKNVLQELLTSSEGTEKARLLRSLAKIDADEGNTDEAIQKMQQALIGGAGADATIELCQLFFGAGREADAIGTLIDLASQPSTEPGMILSGAVLAYNHGKEDLVRQLGVNALDRVKGGPDEEQVLSILRSVGVTLDEG